MLAIQLAYPASRRIFFYLQLGTSAMHQDRCAPTFLPYPNAKILEMAHLIAPLSLAFTANHRKSRELLIFSMLTPIQSIPPSSSATSLCPKKLSVTWQTSDKMIFSGTGIVSGISFWVSG